MNKKIVLGVGIVLFSIFALVNSAFADFDAIYTVGSSGSATLKDVFDWNEQPWLYLDLPSETKTYTVSWWYSPSEIIYDTFEVTSGTDKVWHTLGDWFDVRQVGWWNIKANYSSASGQGTGWTGFTVTPEPLNSILFLVGAGVLGLLKRPKRKLAESL